AGMVRSLGHLGDPVRRLGTPVERHLLARRHCRWSLRLAPGEMAPRWSAGTPGRDRECRRGATGRCDNQRRLMKTAARADVASLGTNVSARVLEVRDLSVRFGAVTAVDKVSLTVRPGEIVGLIGPNGAGKSTLVDAICGFVRPHAGRISLGGTDLT